MQNKKFKIKLNTDVQLEYLEGIINIVIKQKPKVTRLL